MPKPVSDEEFLIRARELRAAQRLRLAPPPGRIGRKTLAQALGISVNTARKLETRALLKASDGLLRAGLTLAAIRSLLSPPPTDQ
jgi:transcriptional regulator with XRE-family HTH domain